jgi:hypothetical protein
MGWERKGGGGRHDDHARAQSRKAKRRSHCYARFLPLPSSPRVPAIVLTTGGEVSVHHTNTLPAR